MTTGTMGQGMKGRNKRIDQAVRFQVCTMDVCTARRVRTESRGGGILSCVAAKKKTRPSGSGPLRRLTAEPEARKLGRNLHQRVITHSFTLSLSFGTRLFTHGGTMQDLASCSINALTT